MRPRIGALGLLKETQLKLRQVLFTLAMLITTQLVFASCGKPEQSQLSIGGGEPNLSSNPSVVRIALRNQSICSGILVAKDLVLTAAHCLKVDDTGVYTVVFPESDSDKLRVITEFQKVREDSLAFFPNFDLAWIKLVGEAPEPYRPAAILGNSSAIVPQNALTLVGAANDTPCHPTDAVCRMVKLGMRLTSTWSSPHLINLAVVDSIRPTDNSGTCPGDSGGPAFIHYQGQDVVYGVVAGKDPIFTGGIATSCGSPTSVLTRVGEYQDWIEETSGRSLNVIDPSSQKLSVDFLSSTLSDEIPYTQWQDWFTKPMPNDSAWATVHKLLEQIVLESKESIDPKEIPTIFQSGGTEWIDKITTLRSLTLGFPDQSVAIEDLRPLIALKNLNDLTFLARAYKGMNVLEVLPALQTLSIVGRVVPRQDQGLFTWNRLNVPSLETLRLSQIMPSQLITLDWSKLPKLKTLVVSAPLHKVGISWLKSEGLTNLETLQIQELSCDIAVWPTVALPKLKSLNLRSTAGLTESEIACLRWDLMPNLSEISVQGYRIDSASFAAKLPKNLGYQIKTPTP